LDLHTDLLQTHLVHFKEAMIGRS